MKRFLLASLAALPACGFIPPAATVPMAVVDHRPSAHPEHETLIIFLPGRHSRAGAFADEGFVTAVRTRKLPVDLVSADAHWGYYVARTLEQRLHEDVMAPFRGQDYQRLWLVGISAGGFGAMMYDRSYPGEVSGIVALAAFLGERSVFDDVLVQGGLGSWVAPAVIPPGDYELQLWDYLRGYADATQKRPHLFIGYGNQDRFAPANQILGAGLPEGHAITTPGGHDWDTWRALWGALLDSPTFKRVLLGKT
jgi:pimeloyl-ACP methyl ester carboxylesterase